MKKKIHGSPYHIQHWKEELQRIEAEITTLEGLNDNPLTQKLQQAFVEKGGVQCGFCTPGVLVSTTALLTKVPQPTDEQLKDVLEGTICRCTGYQPILDSIHHALKS